MRSIDGLVVIRYDDSSDRWRCTLCHVSTEDLIISDHFKLEHPGMWTMAQLAGEIYADGKSLLYRADSRRHAIIWEIAGYGIYSSKPPYGVV